MSRKTVALLQARMGSTRLPGKILMDIAGKPMMDHVVTRTMRAKTLDEVVVTTSDLPGDDVTAAYCAERGWPVFRGSSEDVLDRFYQAAKAHGGETLVRITCDCPMIEPDIIDDVVRLFERTGADYAVNGWKKLSYPRGISAEAFSFAALERAWREDKNPAWREHGTPYLYMHPELFKLEELVSDKDYSAMRWTVDTPEDMAFVRKIFEAFGHDRFTWKETLALLEKHPDWLEINRHIVQKTL